MRIDEISQSQHSLHLIKTARYAAPAHDLRLTNTRLAYRVLLDPAIEQGL